MQVVNIHTWAFMEGDIAQAYINGELYESFKHWHTQNMGDQYANYFVYVAGQDSLTFWMLCSQIFKEGRHDDNDNLCLWTITDGDGGGWWWWRMVMKAWIP